MGPVVLITVSTTGFFPFLSATSCFHSLIT